MTDMHHAVRRLVAATEARRKAHHGAVTSAVQDRSEQHKPAGRHEPAGPAFPLQLTEGTPGGGDPQDH